MKYFSREEVCKRKNEFHEKIRSDFCKNGGWIKLYDNIVESLGPYKAVGNTRIGKFTDAYVEWLEIQIMKKAGIYVSAHTEEYHFTTEE